MCSMWAVPTTRSTPSLTSPRITPLSGWPSGPSASGPSRSRSFSFKCSSNLSRCCLATALRSDVSSARTVRVSQSMASMVPNVT
ncbi:MAG TPA: hypothetical protein VE153_35520, partial [Myxococcus sp.]|nr:hypothetical protein [Myxococcus sp.]